MKALNIILLSSAFFTVSLFGQATSPKEIVEKTVPKDQRTSPESPAPPPGVTPTPAPATTTNQPAPLLKPEPVRVIPVVRQKTEEELREIEAKTVAFQTTRASEGSASAQYDLGIRYHKGIGVEQNDAEARRWLEAAAAQGNTLAITKLAEMNQQ